MTALQEAYKLPTKVNDIGILLMAPVCLNGASMVNFCSLPKLSAVVLPQRTHNPGVVTVEDTN